MATFTGNDLRKIILERSMEAKTGHIGSCLSIADIMAALYSQVMNIPSATDEKRDRFVLSKGHASLALYAALWKRGFISQDTLNTFHSDGSLLGTHPDALLPGVEFSSGSLGQGISFAVGLALAAKMKGSNHRVFVLVSDAECDEGVVWEAAMFAAQHKLSNLVAILDYNRQQAFGYTKDVLDLSPMADKWKNFGWNVVEVDGHDVNNLSKTFSGLDTKGSSPHMVVAKTTFGKGVSFMESQIKWHYSPMDEALFKQAMGEVSKLL